jgi:Lon protease-like protein
MDLPGLIPIFPLPNVVLFPGVPLPLHVFEPRYRDMVRDAEEAGGGVIGMVLLRGDWRKDYHGCPEVFPRGCAGRLGRVTALRDGRYNILLHGLAEFEIVGEDRSRTYRRAHVRWLRDPAPALPEGFRAHLRGLLVRFTEHREPGLAEKICDDPALADVRLVNLLCAALDFSPLEKQALLEAPTLAERGARLCDVLQFAIDAGAGDRSPGEGSYH